jgi:hypothetical protein
MDIYELENTSGVKPVQMTNLTAGEKVLKEQSIAMDFIINLPNPVDPTSFGLLLIDDAGYCRQRRPLMAKSLATCDG